MPGALPPELFGSFKTEVELSLGFDSLTRLAPAQVVVLLEFLKSLSDDDYNIVETYLKFFKAFNDQVLKFPPFDDDDNDGADMVSFVSENSPSNEADAFLKIFFELYAITIRWDSLSDKQKQKFEQFVIDNAEVIAIILDLKQKFDVLITRALISIANTPVPQA